MRDDFVYSKPTDRGPDDGLLELYVAGECTPGEVVALERWMAANPEQGRVLRAMRLVGRAEAVEGDPRVDVAAAERRVVERVGNGGEMDASRAGELSARVRIWMRENSSEQSVRGMGGLGSRTLRKGVWYGTVGVVLAMLLLVGWNVRMSRIRGQMASARLIYTTANSQRANITLPDGNTVMLNVASRLEVPADYAAGHHEVRLVGEGMFTVPHHSGMPFTVLAGSAAVRVLGTSFLVRYRATDSTTLVAVRDGKVAFRSVVLAAAQQVTVSRTGVGRVQGVNPTQFGFTMGVLTLDGVLLPEAIAELDRWYDVDIRLGDPALATLRIAGEYAAGSIAELSEILVNTYNVRVVRSGRVLTLYPR